jgi:putative spermidine/putrescine transport system substrate-binding protein
VPADLLNRGEVVMSSAYNGRVFTAQAQRVPLIILWDGQLVEHETWVITGQAATPKPEAIEFIRFATTAAAQARLAEYIPYGPTRRSAFERIGKHPEHNLPMAAHLPTAPHHLIGALFKDSEWSANTASLRQRAFDNWLKEPKSLSVD